MFYYHYSYDMYISPMLYSFVREMYGWIYVTPIINIKSLNLPGEIYILFFLIQKNRFDYKLYPVWF